MNLGTAAFPTDDPSAPHVKAWVQHAIGWFGARGRFVRWSLPSPIDASPSTVRLRRAALLFMLGLPGSVQLDVDAEREVQSGHVLPPFDVDEVLRRAHASPEHSGISAWAQPGADVNWQSYPRGINSLVYSGTRENWGAMVIANFGDSPLGMTDGSVLVASDHPYVAANDDSLPALTTVWFACK